jgi:UDP-glucose:(glucosyl)LPS alpha-1,2-glucosyltransferase
VKPAVAVVLPPRESVAADRAGAIGLLVGRLAPRSGAFVPVVLGAPIGKPPEDVAFRAVQPSWFPGSRTRRYAGGVAAALKSIGPALVEVHNRPDVALFLARRCPGLPVVLFLHNDPQGMRGAATAVERARLLARLAGVVTVSEHLRRRLLEGVTDPAMNPAVQPNSLDLAAIPAAVSRETLILFAGRVVADKGADAFVGACARALRELPGWRAEMIGADRFGPDSPETPWLASLRLRAEAAGISLRGYRPHAEVLEVMAHAAIVAVPSRWPEPFGLTALEAMACGAALVASDRGGLPEVCGEAAVTIDPDDVEGFATVLVGLARDPGRRAALGAAGRARAVRFDVGTAAARLDTLRSDVLAAWKRRHAPPI